MNEIQAKFDYTEVAPDIADKLHKHEATIKGIQSKAIFEIGTELQAAHDELANYHGGTFYSWCESIGIGIGTVKNIMNYHELVSKNFTNRTMLEELPKSLVYAAAKPSAPPELTQKVLDGEITTHKQWQKERKALQDRVEQAEARAEQAEQENATLTEQYNAQAKELQDLRDNPTVVETPADPRLEAELAEEKQKRSEEKQKRIEAEQQIAWLKQNPPEPKDYRANKRRIEELERDVATYKAHEEGLTLQQKAMIDEEVAKYKNTASEEIHKSMRIMDLIVAVRNLPKNMEVADYAESHIRQEVGGEAHARADIEKMVIDMKVICEELDKYLHKERKLQVVK